MTTALSLFLGFDACKLWVYGLDGGAESGLELHRYLVGKNLIFARFDGAQYGAYEIGRVHLGVGGVRSHRRVDVPDVDAHHMDPLPELTLLAAAVAVRHTDDCNTPGRIQRVA
ncbi:hypothetical protein StoSoilB3_43300 (plasmid) [Arthrobacter sp. StoSoilB3]|nr:hypothetical protein StoSoilB3_43300 [Arthrobacter sp. StoSoilB3]